MPWYAVESLDDAFDATRALLTPLDAGQWFRLALVVFFLGSAGGGGPSASVSGSNTAPADGAFGPPDFELDAPLADGDVLLVVAAALGVVVVLGLLYALVGAVMEFVFVETLRRQRIRIREYADQHLGQAVQLFAFRIALALVALIPAAALAWRFVSVALGDSPVSVVLLVVLVPLFVVLGLVVAAVDAFTINFVVPVMIRKNVGIRAGWRRFWPTLTGAWRQYGVYALVRFVLALAVGLLASVVGGVVGAVLLVPLAVAGVVAIPALGGLSGLLASPVAVAVAVLVGLAYVVLLMAFLAVVFVPVQSFLRYHALLVLGDTNSEFDLIPELRREIRGPE